MPLFAETVTILTGASSIGWGRVALAALAGSAPEAVLYAGAGALAHGAEEAARIWVALLLVAGTLWIIQRPPGRLRGGAPRQGPTGDG